MDRKEWKGIKEIEEELELKEWKVSWVCKEIKEWKETKEIKEMMEWKVLKEIVVVMSTRSSTIK